MDWPLATWTLSTEAPRELLEGVLRELGYRHMLSYIKDVDGERRVSLIGMDRENPSAELERIRVVLVKLGSSVTVSRTR